MLKSSKAHNWMQLYYTTEHTHVPRSPSYLWYSQAIPLLFCLWRLILSLPTTLTPFACPTTRSHHCIHCEAIIIVMMPFSHHNDHQENFELSKGCYVKGWGKDIFGKEGEYQVYSFPELGISKCLPGYQEICVTIMIRWCWKRFHFRW